MTLLKMPSFSLRGAPNVASHFSNRPLCGKRRAAPIHPICTRRSAKASGGPTARIVAGFVRRISISTPDIVAKETGKLVVKKSRGTFSQPTQALHAPSAHKSLSLIAA